jgi:hypothetical protein
MFDTFPKVSGRCGQSRLRDGLREERVSSHRLLFGAAWSVGIGGGPRCLSPIGGCPATGRGSRICPFVLQPPLAKERRGVLVELPKAWRDGTTHAA